MKKKWTKREKWLGGGLVGSLLLSFVLIMNQLGFSLGDEKMVTVSRVIDGDTVDFADGTRGRLIGIDAPEYPKGCLSKRAKERLEELVLGKEVHVIDSGKDKFSRLKVQVRVEGVRVNKAMVSEGLAAKDEGYDEEIEQAENEAKTTKRGIWSSECTAEQKGCEIKGNWHQGTKDRIYHLPGCYNYNQININPNEGDRWFCTEAEAEAAGFVKSKDCPGEK